MATGRVKWYNNAKEYALIIDSETDKEIPTFGHSACLLDGQKVEYQLTEKNGITVAENVTLKDSRYFDSPPTVKPLKENVLCDRPRISYYDNVLSAEICDYLIKKCDNEWIDPETHSEMCHIQANAQQDAKNINRKAVHDLDYKDFNVLSTNIMAALGKPYYLIESLDFLCYEQGHFINAHHDFLYDPRKFNYYKKGGTRQSMAFIFLNDDFEGGETYFNHLDVTIHPKQGRLAYWQQDYDIETNWSTIHEGKEVTKGKKYTAIMCLSSLPRCETKGY